MTVPKRYELEDDQWEACGYDIKREKGEKYIELYRKPLKRFEDIDMSKSDGVTIISSEKDKTKLEMIKQVIINNPGKVRMTIYYGDSGQKKSIQKNVKTSLEVISVLSKYQKNGR